jgi:hypothetical protein
MSGMRALACMLLAAGLVEGVHAQSAASDDGASHHWVGYIVPPYPSGWTEFGGGCIGSDESVDTRCRHAIAEVRDAQSGIRMILALEQVKSFGNRPLSRVVAALEPDALSDRGLVVAYDLCQLRGVDDSKVVAIVRYDEHEWLPAHEAWRFDTAAGRFVILEPASVRCRNEGFGYDG